MCVFDVGFGLGNDGGEVEGEGDVVDFMDMVNLDYVIFMIYV